MTVQCCKCKRLKDGADWFEAAEAPTGPISHTYCPDCLEITHLEFFTAQASCSPVHSASVVNHLVSTLAASA